MNQIITFFQKDMVSMHIGPKATTTNFYFWLSFKNFFGLPHTQYAGKNRNSYRNQGSHECDMIKTQQMCLIMNSLQNGSSGQR
jgi:hypothetical protein